MNYEQLLNSNSQDSCEAKCKKGFVGLGTIEM